MHILAVPLGEDVDGAFGAIEQHFEGRHVLGGILNGAGKACTYIFGELVHIYHPRSSA